MDYAEYDSILKGNLSKDNLANIKAIMSPSTQVTKAKNNKVLILGGHGFVGKAVTKVLLLANYRVFAPTKAQCDCTNFTSLFKAIESCNPAYVVNLAAFVGGIGLNKQYPYLMGSLNSRIGLNVLDAVVAMEHSAPKLVQVGTVCMYPNTPQSIPFREDELWDGMPEVTNAPYGLAKKLIGYLGQSAHQQVGLDVVNLVPTNMYGPADDFSDNASHVIPAIIKKVYNAAKNNTSVTLWGDGSPTREFLYVNDFAVAVLKAIQSENKVANSGRFINIGSGVEISIKNLVETIVDVLGVSVKVEWDTSKPNGQPRRLVDSSSALELLEFKAETSFNDGLANTVSWFQQNIVPLL